MSGALHNRCAIVTGASQGLGLEIARRFVTSGARVLICAREEGPLQLARSELQSLADDDRSVIAMAADVSVERDVSRLVVRAAQEFGRVQVLVNNAGVIGPCGSAESVDWREWVRTIEINLLGSVLLCRALLPQFKQAGYGKIIQLSGGGATSPLFGLSAYAASKAAVIRFAETLAEETREHHIDVNSIAPGGLNTRILEQLIAAGPERIGPALYEQALQSRRQGGVPLVKGADLAVFLASAASDGITGKLLSAVWDPWEELPEHRQELSRTDVYTLRRIVPQDRGLPWRKPD